MEPSSSPSLRATADQHLKAGELTAAIRCYGEHLQTSPDDLEARYALGSAHAAAQQWRLAADEFSRVIQERPDLARAHASKALVERELGNLSAAAEGFFEASSLDPNADYFNHLGTTYAQMGQRDLAIPAFQRAVACDPQAEAAHANLMQAVILRPPLSISDPDEARLKRV